MRIVIRRSASLKGVGRGLLAMALLFGASGGALIYLDRNDAPPPLSQLQRDVGRLGGIRLRRYAKGIPRLVLTIGGLPYTVDSYGADWLDSIRTTLHTGDLLTVWSRQTPSGMGQIWQLARRDSLVVSYAERSERKVGSNARTDVLAEILLGAGAAALIGSAFMSRRDQGAG